MEKFYVVESKVELEQVNLVNGTHEYHNADVVKANDLFEDIEEVVDFRLTDGRTLLIQNDLAKKYCRYSDKIAHNIYIQDDNKSINKVYTLDWADEINHMLVKDYTYTE